jgi:hypothetical protein
MREVGGLDLGYALPWADQVQGDSGAECSVQNVWRSSSNLLQQSPCCCCYQAGNSRWDPGSVLTHPCPQQGPVWPLWVTGNGRVPNFVAGRWSAAVLWS